MNHGRLIQAALIVLPFTPLSSCSAACFFPNGTNRNTDPLSPYLPCNPDADVTMCCATWDTCLSNGLCYNGSGNSHWRETCTDKTWKSSKCIKLFVGSVDGGWSDDVRVTPCENGSFCNGYGSEAEECCRKEQGLFIENGTATRRNPKDPGEEPSPVSTPGLRPSDSGSSVSSDSTITSAPNDNALSRPAKIGIGLGVAFGVILTSLLTAVLLVLRKRRIATPATEPVELAHSPSSSAESKPPKLNELPIDALDEDRSAERGSQSSTIVRGNTSQTFPSQEESQDSRAELAAR